MMSKRCDYQSGASKVIPLSNLHDPSPQSLISESCMQAILSVSKKCFFHTACCPTITNCVKMLCYPWWLRSCKYKANKSLHPHGTFIPRMRLRLRSWIVVVCCMENAIAWFVFVSTFLVDFLHIQICYVPMLDRSAHKHAPRLYLSIISRKFHASKTITWLMFSVIFPR